MADDDATGDVMSEHEVEGKVFHVVTYPVDRAAVMEWVSDREYVIRNDVRSGDTRVTIDPAMRSGAPCIDGTRLPVYLVAGMAWADGVDAAAESYEITREQVLTACWFVAAYGIDHLATRRRIYRLSHGPSGGWRKVWGEWAIEAHSAMWAGDWDKVTDPPVRAA